MIERGATSRTSGHAAGSARGGARTRHSRRIARFAGALGLALSAALAHGAERWDAITSWQFSRYTVDNGLPNSALTALAQDRDGFIWIGSQSGLMRFDGYHFRTYQHDPHDPGSLPSNFVQSLYADERGYLWVGTANAGLARYDPRRGRFFTYPVGGKSGISAADVEAVIDDGAQGLWVGTEGGVDHLSIATGEVTHLETGPRPSENLSHDHVLAIHRESGGSLLVGDRGGLRRVYPEAQSYQHLAVTDSSGNVVATGADAFAEDDAHRLWIGTTDHGVALLDSGGTVSLPRLRGTAAAALADQSVRGIVHAPDGKLILATYGGGLFVLDPATLAVRQVAHSDADQSSLMDDEAYGLLRDRSGLLWVATEQGLCVTDPSQTAFQTAVPDRMRTDRLSEGNSLAILIDSQQRLWVGHHSSGADVFAPDGTRLTTLQPRDGRAVSAADRSVYAFAESADGTVWMGTRHGLYRVHAPDWRVTAVPLPGEADGPNVQRLLADDRGLWVGTRGGLFRYEIGPQRWRSYPGRASGGVSDPFIIALARAGDGRLWVGTRKGLNLLDPATGEAVRFTTDTRLAQAFIMDLWSAPDGRLWVATIDDGVYLLTPRAGAFEVRHLTEEDGLPSMNIDALQRDLAGGVWVSTANGLALIETRSLSTHKYQRADGVRFGDYWAHASALTPDGDVVFGGVGGLTVVHPGLIAERHFQSQLLVSAIDVGGHALAAIPPANGAAGVAPLLVNPGANSFQVEFAATDYTAPQSLRYAYLLEGYDNDWTTVDATKRSAAYTNLSPGDYLLKVRATNRAGAYAAAMLRIPVRVRPAWYQAWWFRVLAAAAAIGVVALLIHARTAYLRLVKRRLERLVARRTEELRRSKEQIEMIAYLDAMTGLPNRRLFAERFDNFRASADRNRKGFTLVLVDLDKFKQINDTLGHAAGDAVLVSTAQRLKGATREVDVVARLGGDEFAVLLDATELPEAIGGVCQRISQSFAPPVEFEGHKVQVGISMGCAVYPRDAGTQSELYKVADLALYDAKRAGRNTWRIYAPKAEATFELA